MNLTYLMSLKKRSLKTFLERLILNPLKILLIEIKLLTSYNLMFYLCD